MPTFFIKSKFFNEEKGQKHTQIGFDWTILQKFIELFSTYVL